MAGGPGPLTRPRPDTVAMPKRGKRLKFRAQDACSGRGREGAKALKGLGLEAGGGQDSAVASACAPATGGRPGLGTWSEQEISVGRKLTREGILL